MEKSPKSYLFELYDRYKDKMSKPQFEFKQEKHNNCYWCTINLTINSALIKINSDEFSKKKDAEHNACYKILNYLYNNNIINDFSLINYNGKNDLQNDSDNYMDDSDNYNYKIAIIVDHENISKKKEIDGIVQYISLMKKNNIYCKLIKIAGYTSSVCKTADIIVRSARKNAVDHYISFYSGQLIINNIYDEIIIISRDHFAACLSDFSDKLHHCVDLNDLIYFFKSSTYSIY